MHNVNAHGNETVTSIMAKTEALLKQLELSNATVNSAVARTNALIK